MRRYRWWLFLIGIALAAMLCETTPRVLAPMMPVPSTEPVTTESVIAEPVVASAPEPRLRRIVTPADGESFANLRQRLVSVDAEILGWGGEGYDTLATASALDALVQGGSQVTETPLPITGLLSEALRTQPEVEATLVFTTFEEAEAVAKRFGGRALRDAVIFTAPSDEVMELLENSTTILAGDVVLEATVCNATSRSDVYLGADTLQFPELNQTRLLGDGEIVGVLDTGCSAGIDDWETSAHPGLKDQILRLSPQPWNRLDPGNCKDNNGHGTHVVGTIVGTGAESDNNQYRGVAPGAKVFFQGASSTGSGTLDLIPSILDCVFDDAYASGARLHSNSWGSGTSSAPASYGLMAWSMDRYTWDHQDFLPLFAAGNTGTISGGAGNPSLMTMGSFTATAKNTLVVGGADYQDGKYKLAKYSSGYSDTGPLSDGRMKPDVLTPSVNIWSTSKTTGYHASSGTSMATPLTAGACAVIRQYCREELGIASPSSPLVRALLISGCENVLGDAPNGYEGFGLTSLTRSLTPETGKPITKTFEYDEETAETMEINVTAEGRLRATLVWLDAPAPLWSMSALVNDLDLSITDAQGNVVTLDDHVNVIERLDVPVTPGTYTVTVKAKKVPMNGGAAALVVNAPMAEPTPAIEKIVPKDTTVPTVKVTVVTEGTDVLRREVIEAVPGEEITLTAKTLVEPRWSDEDEAVKQYLHNHHAWSRGEEHGIEDTVTFTVPEEDCTFTWETDGGTPTTYCGITLYRTYAGKNYGGSVYVLPGSDYTLPALKENVKWEFPTGVILEGGTVLQNITGHLSAEAVIDTSYVDTTAPVIVLLRDPPVASPVTSLAKQQAAIQVYDAAAYDPLMKFEYPLSSVTIQRREKGGETWDNPHQTTNTYATKIWIEPLKDTLITEYRFGVADKSGQMTWTKTFELEVLSPVLDATLVGNLVTVSNNGNVELEATIECYVGYGKWGDTVTVKVAPGASVTHRVDFGTLKDDCTVAVKPVNAVIQTGGKSLLYTPLPGYHFRLQ